RRRSARDPGFSPADRRGRSGDRSCSSRKAIARCRAGGLRPTPAKRSRNELQKFAARQDSFYLHARRVVLSLFAPRKDVFSRSEKRLYAGNRPFKSSPAAPP